MKEEKTQQTICTDRIPVPMCMVDENGKITSASQKIGDVFLYDGIVGADVFALLGVKLSRLREAAREGSYIEISRFKRKFRIVPAFQNEGDTGLVLYFVDITESEEIRLRYEKEQPCFMLISIDNYDELIGNSGDELASDLSGAVDREIRNWCAGMHASVTRYRGHNYLVVLSKASLEMAARNKFDVLDKVRKLETEHDFPVTLSIGVGMGGKTPDENDHFSAEALDIALGRGGDQAVIKHGNRLFYYGGKSQAVEKSNKGKSRLIGHALARLISTSSRVLIMGHQNPDMDAFGAALGIYRLATVLNKEAYVIINQYNEALERIYNTAKKTEEYEIISNHRATDLADDRTLVVVVDTHRPSITECPELLSMVPRVAVIDHHRKSEEFVRDPTLAYEEPYASSASELVTEILQYTLEKKQLTRFEAEALMAGIAVDTNRFSVKTGVRTFEAAAWLRRNGADMAVVKQYFQVNRDVFDLRIRGLTAAEFTAQGMAFSIVEGCNENAQIVNSQVADELLTVNGVRASFVAGRDIHGRCVVSARSVGNLNVQVIMEHFGGGGHLNTAGAQMDMEPKQAIEHVKKILEKEYESHTDEGR